MMSNLRDTIRLEKILERLNAKIKECHENAGGMEFGMVLEEIRGEIIDT